MTHQKRAAKYHISILGKVGTGKSTLARLIQQRVDCTLYLEDPADHPFIRLFFDDPGVWGFANMLTFMLTKIAHQGYIRHFNQLAVQEVDAWANNAIWSPVMRDIGYISQAEVATLGQLYDMLAATPVSTPDLWLVLQVSWETQLNRIRGRGRDYEELAPDFVRLLKLLEQSFAELVAKLPDTAMLIDTEAIDFTQPSRARNDLLDAIVQHIPRDNDQRH
jgi:deoxyguanosine kinase